MTKKATTDEIYEPEQLDLVRDVDAALDTKLTGKPAVEDLAAAIRRAAFEWEVDDIITLSTAEEFKVTDNDSYTRGFEILGELSLLEDRIEHSYAKFDKPLNFLVGVVRKLKGPQAKTVLTLKQALSKRLGLYKAQREEAERKGFRHFLEVFDPNVESGVAPEKLGEFINDNILRTLAGVPESGRSYSPGPKWEG